MVEPTLLTSRLVPADPSSPGFVRLLREPPTEAGRLQRGVELAVALIDECDHASVTVLTPHYVETVAVSDDVARRGDAWQHDLSEGPGLESVRRQVPVVSQDLRADPRWRAWGPRAVEWLGMRSVVSVPLDARGGGVGALNLYADHPQAWDPGQRTLAAALAGQVAVAAADARLLDSRTAALLARRSVGQAQGLVMERFGLTAEQAFDYLQRLSADLGVGLPHLAERLVETRDLPRP